MIEILTLRGLGRGENVQKKYLVEWGSSDIKPSFYFVSALIFPSIYDERNCIPPLRPFVHSYLSRQCPTLSSGNEYRKCT